MIPTPRAWLRMTPADIEELGALLCSVADNLGDMPVSDEWAAKTSSRAFGLLARNEYFCPPDAAPNQAATPFAWIGWSGMDRDTRIVAMRDGRREEINGPWVAVFDQSAIDSAVTEAVAPLNAEIAALLRGVRIRIPNEAMEQEIANHARRAVAAEKERCANLAESWPNYRISVTSIGPQIAQQIRGPKP